MVSDPMIVRGQMAGVSAAHLAGLSAAVIGAMFIVSEVIDGS